jgi:glycosyltransferase involved in cell wall biosynthesis
MGRELKVLHLSTSRFGGAGIAAFRLHSALIQLGIHSNFISRDGESKIKFNHLNSFTSSALTLLQQRLIQNDSSLITPISMDFFQKFRKEADEANVIHIHANYNLFSHKIYEYARINNKLLVCTLHDERAYTGGCHVSKECNSFSSNCSNCPQASKLGKKFVKLSFNKQLDFTKALKNLVYISPSHWIDGRFKTSTIGKSSVSYCIPNPVPDYFNTSSDQSIRQKSDKKIITFVSHDLENPIKNLNLIRKALASLSKSEIANLELNLIGNGSINGFPPELKVNRRGYVSSHEIAEIFKVTDLVIVPSLYDNFPSVVTEALMAGCYVIGSNVGGIPEPLSKFQMPIIDPRDHNNLGKEIVKSPNRGSDEISTKAYNLFGFDVIGSQILDVYSQHKY